MPLGKRGVIRFYARRLSVIVPMYWLWILCVSIFVQSDILRPGPTHIKMLLAQVVFVRLSRRILSGDFWRSLVPNNPSETLYLGSDNLLADEQIN